MRNRVNDYIGLVMGIGRSNTNLGFVCTTVKVCPPIGGFYSQKRDRLCLPQLPGKKIDFVTHSYIHIRWYLYLICISNRGLRNSSIVFRTECTWIVTSSTGNCWDVFDGCSRCTGCRASGYCAT